MGARMEYDGIGGVKGGYNRPLVSLRQDLGLCR